MDLNPSNHTRCLKKHIRHKDLKGRKIIDSLRVSHLFGTYLYEDVQLQWCAVCNENIWNNQEPLKARPWNVFVHATNSPQDNATFDSGVL